MEKFVLLIMDVVLLCALAWAMYYMRQILNNIKVIREGKTELQQILQQLNIHISNAQHSIDNMNKLADMKAQTIQKQIESATASIDELQFIQRAAENVAQRLERATGQSSPIKADELRAPARTAEKQPERPMSKAEKELADAMASRRAKAAGE